MTLESDWVDVEIEGIRMGYLSDHYQPELHYMRGPGPKWLEKHAGQSGASAIERGRKTPTLIRAIELTLRRWLPTR